VVAAQALVGSSNFTRLSLTHNIELNIQVQSGREVAQPQEWFEQHWDEAEDVTEDVSKVISRHTVELTPFDIYTKALHPGDSASPPSAETNAFASTSI